MDHTHLLVALNNAGTHYQQRSTHRGDPYVGFFWSASEGAKPIAVTAIVEEKVLRLTTHNLRCESQPHEIASMISKLPIGTVFISPENQEIDMSLGLYFGDNIVDGDGFLHLLNYLYCSRNQLEENINIGCEIPDLGDQQSCHGEDFAEAFTQYGHQTKAIHNGIQIEIATTGSLSYQLELVELQAPWIKATGKLSVDKKISFTDEHSVLFQRLQRWTKSGRFMPTPDNEISAEVHAPLFGKDRRQSIIWVTSQLVLMLQTASNHLE